MKQDRIIETAKQKQILSEIDNMLLKIRNDRNAFLDTVHPRPDKTILEKIEEFDALKELNNMIGQLEIRKARIESGIGCSVMPPKTSSKPRKKKSQVIRPYSYGMPYND